MTISGEPACWSWPVTAAHVEAVAACPENFAHFMLWNWQMGLCAICAQAAQPGRPVFRDHDHVTGLIRGLLCQRCNVGEGHTAAGIPRPVPLLFDRYRERPPVILLGLRARHLITSGPTGKPLPKFYSGDLEIPVISADSRRTGPWMTLTCSAKAISATKEPDHV